MYNINYDKHPTHNISLIKKLANNPILLYTSESLGTKPLIIFISN